MRVSMAIVLVGLGLSFEDAEPNGADGSFTVPTTTFIVSVHAPPGAVRTAYFSAICLDCLAGASPQPPPSRAG
jgi:hypothetical protein